MPVTAIKQRDGAETDLKKVILDKLGDISAVEVAQNEVLLAIFMRPETTASGLVIPGAQKEDRYQGKAGLVVKIGEACVFEHKDEYSGAAFKLDVKLHDWVVVRTSDTWTFDLTSDPNAFSISDFVPCRLVRDKLIRLRVPSPLMIW